jgi:hypothetical protein
MKSAIMHTWVLGRYATRVEVCRVDSAHSVDEPLYLARITWEWPIKAHSAWGYFRRLVNMDKADFASLDFAIVIAAHQKWHFIPCSKGAQQLRSKIVGELKMMDDALKDPGASEYWRNEISAMDREMAKETFESEKGGRDAVVLY